MRGVKRLKLGTFLRCECVTRAQVEKLVMKRILLWGLRLGRARIGADAGFVRVSRKNMCKSFVIAVMS